MFNKIDSMSYINKVMIVVAFLSFGIVRGMENNLDQSEEKALQYNCKQDRIEDFEKDFGTVSTSLNLDVCEDKLVKAAFKVKVCQEDDCQKTDLSSMYDKDKEFFWIDVKEAVKPHGSFVATIKKYEDEDSLEALSTNIISTRNLYKKNSYLEGLHDAMYYIWEKKKRYFKAISTQEHVITIFSGYSRCNSIQETQSARIEIAKYN